MNFYIPFLYSEKVKRPDKNFFLLTVLGEDLAILLLAFSFAFTPHWGNALGLFLLQASFWCIYEIGYIENDILGEKFEDQAVLSYNYNSYKYSFQLWQPWVWALGLALLGIQVFHQEIALKSIQLPLAIFGNYHQEFFPIAGSFLSWTAFLLVLRFLFHIYNHLNKQSRVWFYFLLQACRYGGYLVLLTTNTVGLVLLVSKILIRSMQYILYRYMGGKDHNWPGDFPRYFFFLLIYLLILMAIAVNEGNLSLIFNYQVLAIIAFCILRGGKHFQKVFSQFRPVSRDGSNQIV
ncbi:MAG: hypothetical protein ACRC1Z_22755 [Waterburya sp.]